MAEVFQIFKRERSVAGKALGMRKARRLAIEQNEACGAQIRLKTGFGCSPYASGESTLMASLSGAMDSVKNISHSSMATLSNTSKLSSEQ